MTGVEDEVDVGYVLDAGEYWMREPPTVDSSDMLGAMVEDEGDVWDVLDTGDMLEKDAMKVEKLVACMMPMIRWMRDEDADEVVDVSEYKEDAMEEVNAEGDAGDVLDAGDILDAR